VQASEQLKTPQVGHLYFEGSETQTSQVPGIFCQLETASQLSCDQTLSSMICSFCSYNKMAEDNEKVPLSQSKRINKRIVKNSGKVFKRTFGVYAISAESKTEDASGFRNHFNEM
jgi:hypothetical protein